MGRLQRSALATTQRMRRRTLHCRCPCPALRSHCVVRPSRRAQGAIGNVIRAQHALGAFDEAASEVQRKHDITRKMVTEICHALQGHSLPLDHDLLGRSAIAQISVQRCRRFREPPQPPVCNARNACACACLSVRVPIGAHGSGHSAAGRACVSAGVSGGPAICDAVWAGVR